MGFAFRLRLSLMACSKAAVLVTIVVIVQGRIRCSKVLSRTTDPLMEGYSAVEPFNTTGGVGFAGRGVSPRSSR